MVAWPEIFTGRGCTENYRICNFLCGHHPSQQYFIYIYLFHIVLRYSHRLRSVLDNFSMRGPETVSVNKELTQIPLGLDLMARLVVKSMITHFVSA